MYVLVVDKENLFFFLFLWGFIKPPLPLHIHMLLSLSFSKMVHFFHAGLALKCLFKGFTNLMRRVLSLTSVALPRLIKLGLFFFFFVYFFSVGMFFSFVYNQKKHLYRFCLICSLIRTLPALVESGRPLLFIK